MCYSFFFLISYPHQNTPNHDRPSKIGGKAVRIDPVKIKQCETEIFSNTRLFTNKEFLDSLTLSHRILEDPAVLIECFDILSNSHSFCANQSPSESKAYYCGGSTATGLSNPRASGTNKRHPAKVKPHQKEEPIEKYTRLFPQWFNPNKGGTIFQWISAFLEQTVISKYFELRGANQLPMEEIVGEYRQVFVSYKTLEEYWKSLPQRGKIKMLGDFENAAKPLAQTEKKVASFKTVSISCQVLQKSASAEALSAKEFLCYACYYANPYQLLDTLTFVKLPLAGINF